MPVVIIKKIKKAFKKIRIRNESVAIRSETRTNVFLPFGLKDTRYNIWIILSGEGNFSTRAL